MNIPTLSFQQVLTLAFFAKNPGATGSALRSFYQSLSLDDLVGPKIYRHLAKLVVAGYLKKDSVEVTYRVTAKAIKEIRRMAELFRKVGSMIA